MRYVLDESAIIDFFEARASTAGWLLTVPPRDVALPALSLARLAEMGCLEVSESRKAQLLALLAEIAVVPFGRAEAEKAGELSAAAQRARREMSWVELACAATAIVHRATLVTVRPGVFVDIRDLRVDVR